MASYGRNFEFRVPPVHGERGGRYVLGGTTNITQGVPVRATDGAINDPALTDALPVLLATGAQAPKKGLSGIAVYEVDLGSGFAGLDPLLNDYSDLDVIPYGKMLQVVSGDRVKVVLRNTVTRVFLGARTYTGKTMFAGGGATPTVAVGDFLTPGVGDGTSGYWAETGTAANAWLVVESINTARGEVECRMAF